MLVDSLTRSPVPVSRLPSSPVRAGRAAAGVIAGDSTALEGFEEDMRDRFESSLQRAVEGGGFAGSLAYPPCERIASCVAAG
jgi:hypothetical protein